MVLAVAIVIFGLQPAWMLRWSEATTTTFMPTPAAIVSHNTVLDEYQR